MRLFEVTFGDGDIALVYDMHAIAVKTESGVVALTGDNLAVGLTTSTGQIITKIEEVPLLAYNRKAMQAKIGAYMPDRPTRDYFRNELSIMFGNGGVILCDVNTKFDVEGEDHPIIARRLLQGDTLKSGLIITNIIWVQGDPVSWGGTIAMELIMRTADMADLMQAYSRRIGDRTGRYGRDMEADQTKEALWCAMRFVHGHTVILSRGRGLFNFIVCKPDQATLKGDYVRGQAISEEEVQAAIMAVINNQGD